LITTVTIIAPMLNEIGHVDDFVADIAAQDFEGQVEVFVADGGSSDGSRERLLTQAEQRGVRLTLIDNPRRIVAPGLNACIKHATGELVVRLDCHSRYPPQYVRCCVEAAAATGAWNVGGVYEPHGRTRPERAVACALTSPFGGVNWTRQSDARCEVDTVYLGAFRPVAFEQAGLYDESLVRNQDDELNLRIRLAGGTIVFDPAITCVYTPRGSLRAVWSQYRQYGYWKVAVMRKHRRLSGARSLVPAAFVLQLGILAALATRSATARRLAVVELGVYAVAATAFAARAARQRGEPAALVPRVAVVFPCFHLGYGTGMLAGALRALRGGRTTSGGVGADVTPPGGSQSRE
jgi:succinoglycan biosynthesis protein ExoA